MAEAIARGVVVRGHGVASGRAADPRFPAGTIALQMPVFRRHGVDLAALIGAEPFPGTINIDIAPQRPEMLTPEIALHAIAWSTAAPAESFWLFRAVLTYAGGRHRALIYMPDPSTKPEHFQPASVIETIAPPIARLAAGDSVTVAVDAAHLRFAPPPDTVR